MADMTREEAVKEIIRVLQKPATSTGVGTGGNRFEQALCLAVDALRGLEWVRTEDRLPTKEDAGCDGMVAFCYRDNWDCFNRLEKWSDISPQKYTYWHRMLKAPRSEE